MLTSRSFWIVFAVLCLVSSGLLLAGAWCDGAYLVDDWKDPPRKYFARWLVVGVVCVAGSAATARWIVLSTLRPVGRVISNLHQTSATELNRSLEQPETVLFADELELAARAMSRRVVSQIDDLQRVRTSLEQEHHQLVTVMEAMIEGVIAIDSTERILLANPAAVRLLDLNPEAVPGRPVWEVVRLPQLIESIKRSMNGSGQQRIEFEVPRSQLTIAAVVSKLSGSPLSGAVIVLHDVTDLRRLENLRREFVSNVSHELKTPLAAITAYSESLLDGAIEEPEIAHNFVTRIGEQAERLHTLILELLELARMESDQHQLELTQIDFGDVILTCVDDHQDVARAKSIRLEAEESAEPILAVTDPDGLQTIIDNLLDNAINYTPSGGHVVVRWHRDGDRVELQVADTGIGIAKEHQGRIFERFFRADRARSREVGGTGLGLSIVKHLVLLLGGTVTVNSQLGKGSTFTVRLPKESKRADA